MTTPLVPKIRNLSVGDDGRTTLSISDAPVVTLPSTLARLKVTHRFQPPVGADMFDSRTDAASMSFCPNAHPEATSVDGYVCYSKAVGGDTWAALIGGSGGGGKSANDSAVQGYLVQIRSYPTNTDKWYDLYRSILLFDTSPLPDDCTVTSAVLAVYSYAKADNLGITPDINVYSSTPASNTSLEADDYTDLGSTPYCDAPISYASWLAVGWNYFTLNSAGLTSVSKTGVTKLGLRNANYDVAASAPAWSSDEFSGFYSYFSDNGEYAPQLTVNYTAPAVGYVWVEGANLHHIDETGTEQIQVKQSDFDANTILKANSDNTPEALTVAVQEVVGRLTGGEIDGISLGIADNNVAQIDGTTNTPANLDYTKFTTSGLEGKSYGEVADDIESSIDHGNLAGLTDPDHPATAVSVSELGSATYDDVQDFINFFGDRTYLSGCTISATSPANGTVAVAAGTAWCKETDSNTAVGKFFDFTGQTAIALTDVSANILYLDYNAGTPQVVVATSALTYGFQQDHILLGVVFRNGNETHILQADPLGIQGDNRSHMMRVEEGPTRSSGMVTTSTGTRNLALTAGVLHLGLNRKTTPIYTTPNSGTADATEANTLHDADGGFVASDVGKRIHNTTDNTYTTVTAYADAGQLTLLDDIFVSGETYNLDVFSYWYISAAGPTWTEVQGSAAISNSQYNKTTDPWGLSNLTANRYGVHWVYMDFDSHLHVVYGQGDYTANEAEEAAVPSSLPNVATNFSVIIAKIICQQGTDTLTISYPWTSVFTSSLATDHGSLGGLGDDDHTIYLLADGTRELTDNMAVTALKTIDGRDVSVDGTKLDTVDTNADVTADNAPKAHQASHSPNDGGDALDTAAPAELAGVQASAVGTADTLARADHAHQIQESFADNHLVTINHTGVAENDYAKFTATGGISGKSYSETLADISPLTTRGDIMFRNATVSTRLAKGTEGHVLTMGADDPAWAAASGGVTSAEALAYALCS